MRKKIIIVSIITVFVALSVFLLVRQVGRKEKEMAIESKPSVYHLKVSVVSTKVLSEEISFLGTVVPDQTLVVVSETDGKVVSVFIETGQQVHEGQVLVEVDSSLKIIQYTAYKVAYDKAQKDYNRLKELKLQNNVSDYELENSALQVKQAEAQYSLAAHAFKNARIISPIAGVVVERKINKGDYLQPGMPVAVIINNHKLLVKGVISESDIYRFPKGKSVSITSSSPGQNNPGSGTIKSVVPSVGIGNGFPVEILVNKPDSGLFPGMSVRVSCTSQKIAKIMVPVSTLSGKFTEPKICKIISGKPQFVKVTTGERLNSEIEISRGIVSGDTIVTMGQTSVIDNLNARFVLDF